MLTVVCLYAILRINRKKGVTLTQTVTLVKNDLPIEWLEAARIAKLVGCDIETSGLSKDTDRIATFQMYVPNHGTVMVRELLDYPTVLVTLMENARIQKIFHHAPFDLGFLLIKYKYMQPSRIADTKVAAKLLDPRKTIYKHPITQKGSHSLQTLIHHHFNFMMNKELAVSNWFAPELSEEQVAYAAKDVEYLPELLKQLQKPLRRLGLISELNKAFALLPRKAMLDAKVGGDIYGYE